MISSPDLLPFEMNLLGFRRTFVEKLFTIHGKIERFQADGVHPGRDLRHYADLCLLAETDEVREMLRSPEYAETCADYDDPDRIGTVDDGAGSARSPAAEAPRATRRGEQVLRPAMRGTAGPRRRNAPRSHRPARSRRP